METLDSISQVVNSLAPWRCDSNFKSIISNTEIYVDIYFDKAPLGHNELKQFWSYLVTHRVKTPDTCDTVTSHTGFLPYSISSPVINWSVISFNMRGDQRHQLSTQPLATGSGQMCYTYMHLNVRKKKPSYSSDLNEFTHCGVVMKYGNTDLGQHWLR